MPGNSYGKRFKISTFGESHGKAVGVVVDGCPAGLELSEKDIQLDLTRRRPGQSKITTARDEKDEVQILSGVFEGKTTGAPICLMVFNKDQRSQDYNELKEVYRPGHADWTFDKKYGNRDPRGGGRTSARIMIGRVAAAAIAKKFLKEKLGMEFLAYTHSVGNIDLDTELKNRQQEIQIKSERMILKPISFDYIEDIFTHFTPVVAKYINPNVSSAKNISETAQFIANAIKERQENKTLTFAVLNQKNQEFIGLCSLNNVNTKRISFGLWIKEKAQKQGYGLEIILALKDFAIQNLEFDELVYCFEKNNLGSQKIAQKLGGTEIQRYKEISQDKKREFEWVEYNVPATATANQDIKELENILLQIS
jgi:RimJ/RimL family protein N-acetyltransferase